MRQIKQFALFLVLLSSACKSTQSDVLKLGGGTKIWYLNAADAAHAITNDSKNGYFDLVNPIEISIQMKQAVSDLDATRSKMLTQYRNYLTDDVAAFTASERKHIDVVMLEIFQTCQSISPGLFPKQIRLVKTRGRHYGDGVYYTREDCIVIPQNVLNDYDEKGFKETMYHEVWHIISRYNPELQKKAYALIGYTPVSNKKTWIPTRLRDRVIYNPDGVEPWWQITLTDAAGNTRNCIPLLHTTKEGYQTDMKEFFGYLQFNLYPIEGGKVITKSDSLTSPIQLANEPSFYQQITDNTNYIIHPDEVIADNFMFIMTTAHDVMKRQRFSKPGNDLLVQLEKLLAGK
jgi:hypothetical protein